MNDATQAHTPAWTRGYNEGLWHAYDAAPFPAQREEYDAGYDAGVIEYGRLFYGDAL